MPLRKQLVAILLGLAAQAALAHGGPQDVRAFPPSKGNAEAGTGAGKAAVCGACHGADGNALVPTFPSLARQPQDYLYLQLKSFKEGWRSNAIMQPQVKTLSDQDLHDLAAHFAALPRHVKAVTVNPPAVDRGRILFAEGDTAHGVPPCQGCHGDKAEGHAPEDRTATASRYLPHYSAYPALAGQSSIYLAQQLKAYQSGGRAGTSNARVMQGVAAHLDQDDIDALAAFLSQLDGNP